MRKAIAMTRKHRGILHVWAESSVEQGSCYGSSTVVYRQIGSGRFDFWYKITSACQIIRSTPLPVEVRGTMPIIPTLCKPSAATISLPVILSPFSNPATTNPLRSSLDLSFHSQDIISGSTIFINSSCMALFPDLKEYTLLTAPQTGVPKSDFRLPPEYTLCTVRSIAPVPPIAESVATACLSCPGSISKALQRGRYAHECSVMPCPCERVRGDDSKT